MVNVLHPQTRAHNNEDLLRRSLFQVDIPFLGLGLVAQWFPLYHRTAVCRSALGYWLSCRVSHEHTNSKLDHLRYLQETFLGQLVDFLNALSVERTIYVDVKIFFAEMPVSG